MNRQMIWLGRHEGLLRDCARGVGYGDPIYTTIAANMMVGWIKTGAILVPMPSHIGYATTTLELCKNIKRLSHNTLKVCDCLRCTPHPSCHLQKAEGKYPDTIFMYKNGSACKVSDGSRPVYIIDNVIGTGTTARAALDAIQYDEATVFAITKG